MSETGSAVAEQPQETLHTNQERPFRQNVAENLLRTLDLRAENALAQGTLNARDEQEWNSAGNALIALGVHPGWVGMESVGDRLELFASARSATEAQKLRDEYYKQHDLRKPPPGSSTENQQAESRQTISTERLENHYRYGNAALEAQGFNPNRPYTQELIIDENALAGLETLIEESLDEMEEHGTAAEGAVILVGQRTYLDGKLLTLVFGVLAPSDALITRSQGSVNISYEKVFDAAENTQVVDANGVRMADYEIVGIMHTHPAEVNSNGDFLLSGSMSPEDLSVLKTFDTYAPGFTLGAIIPGALVENREQNTTSLLQDVAHWDRRTNSPQQISSLKII